MNNNFITALIFSGILLAGCYSKPDLWIPSNDSQSHFLTTSFDGDIASSLTTYPHTTARTTIFDSISHKLFKGAVFNALDSHLVIPSKNDTVLIYERRYHDRCGDSRSEFVHKLVLTKSNQSLMPDKSFYINYGCEYYGERMLADEIKSTDTSIIVYGHMSNKSKDYPLWIEITRTKKRN